ARPAAAASGRAGTGRPAAVRLTGRERDIAALVAQGLKNAQIAQQLCLSIRTVEGHIYRTFAKLGISRRDELTPELLAAV
ncbi:response regulator transcription factor, partial [Arthrobacter sp. GCM10027362]|uniref:response regulator transcription factor n=1 Tax=Arthrobacter sp. GCM10027362 TaxID=3273379 RepID=UPI0036369D51